ncbi:caspase domain-containing protein [Mycena maculata]|uniref:Caspase domain-containing protein n=1 Tax=Mycena maculata TaxID=230809 RepID=A0AAD7JVI5_9AGAR|nr:caspase domain-containing protein [Mycena maculata]
MQNSAESECRVFALIIAIDRYEAIHGLNGCVNDANDFKAFLTESLRVPESHIVFIADDAATRVNILSKFDTHLIDNPDIRSHGGDTIIFFYAGHGSRVEAPNNAYSVDGRVETICPHDERGRDENGELIHGIPDYTIHILLQQLAAAKGNNLTAIFDSCHSGGIGRRDLARFAPPAEPIPFDLDHTLIGARAGHPGRPEEFRYLFMESHVLLAACRQEQTAYETTVKGVTRGRFSESLVRTLRAISLEKTTYLDLIDLVGKWNDQDPQVEGNHKNRFLFDGIYPPSSQKALLLLPTNEPGCFEIKMGSIEGVVSGTEFLINDASNNIVGFLEAQSVDLDHSILVRKKDGDKADIIFPSGSKATVSDWKNRDMIMKVFIAPDFDSTVASELFPDRNLDTKRLKSLPIRRKFVPIDSRWDADIQLRRISEEQFSIERFKDIIKDHASVTTIFSVKPDKYSRFPMILDAIAHFHFFLYQHHGGQPIPGITLEMHTLTGPFPVREPSADIFVNKIAEVKYNKTRRYGFTLCNRSHYDLFPYLFFFDPEQYAIDVWYSPPSRAMLPPLIASRDGTTATRLPIGYGGGGYAFEFDLPEGKAVDTGFLKVFVSTEYLDMDWVTQKSPFDPDFAPRLGGGRETIEKGQVWDTFYAVITMKA